MYYLHHLEHLLFSSVKKAAYFVPLYVFPEQYDIMATLHPPRRL